MNSRRLIREICETNKNVGELLNKVGNPQRNGKNQQNCCMLTAGRAVWEGPQKPRVNWVLIVQLLKLAIISFM